MNCVLPCALLSVGLTSILHVPFRPAPVQGSSSASAVGLLGELAVGGTARGEATLEIDPATVALAFGAEILQQDTGLMLIDGEKHLYGQVRVMLSSPVSVYNADSGEDEDYRLLAIFQSYRMASSVLHEQAQMAFLPVGETPNPLPNPLSVESPSLDLTAGYRAAFNLINSALEEPTARKQFFHFIDSHVSLEEMAPEQRPRIVTTVQPASGDWTSVAKGQDILIGEFKLVHP